MPGEFVARQGLISRGNVVVTGSLTTSGSLTATGTITATTLVVQTVTSSISSITGSTNFGSLVSNTHTFTGSILTSGSIGIGTTPSYPLHIFKSSEPEVALQSSSTTFRVGVNSSNECFLYTAQTQPIYFSTSGSERMRITSGGSTEVRSGNTLNIYRTDNTRALQLYTTANECVIDSWEASSEPLMIRSNGSGGRIVFHTNAAERMRITSAGNVCIGTTTSSGYGNVNLDLNAGTLPAAYFVIRTSSNSVIAEYALDSGAAYLSTKTAHPLIFRTSDAERMRITSAGNVLVGQSTADIGTNGWQLQATGGGHTAFAINNNEAFIFNNRNTGTTYQIDFRTNSVERGAINVTDSGTTYATTSDYRVKEDFKDVNGLEKVSAIKVYDFKFKDLDERMDGVIAHELQEILPYAVYGEKDGVKFQGVDYSRIVPVLVKAIQELTARVQELENK